MARGPVFGRVRSAWALLVAAFAMTVMLAIPAHAPAPLSSSQQIAAELKAAFGEAAVLCVQDDDDNSAPATPAPHVHDHCPLCQFHAQASGLHAPDLVCLPGGVARSWIRSIVATDEAPPPSPWPSTSQPRGPPTLV